jgi:hypothetical protein
MFITRYADYATKVIAAPRELHEMVATQLVGSAVGQEVRLNSPYCASGSDPLDLWVLLNGNLNGATAIAQVARPVLEAARLPNLLRMQEWGSMRAVDEDIAQNPTGFFAWGDLPERLKCDGLEQWLTERYDTYSIPKTQDGAHLKHSARMNILASCSPGWFLENFDPAPDRDCLLARWHLLPGISGDIPNAGTPDEDEAKSLGKELRRISFVYGNADTTAVDHDYRDWWSAAQERFRARRAWASFPYHRKVVLKLAVLYEAATSYGVRVSKESWDHAVAIAGKMEESLFAVLDSAPHAQVENPLTRIEERIRSAGKAGLPRSAYTRIFQRWRDRDSQLQALIDSGKVREENRSTRGRPARFLVHRDFWDEDDTSFTSSQVL